MTPTLDTDQFTSWHLSNMADVASPDRSDDKGHDEPPTRLDGYEPSAGATFLRRVARDVADRITEEGDDFDPDEFSDMAHEVADGCVPIYTYERWLTFTDLAAWQEVETRGNVGMPDVAECDGLELSGDMTDMAGQVLYAIALRLVNALVRDMVENADETAEVDA
jgi:hypothetical protein